MVLLLYTSHNSPSHQPRAIFYLGDDISIRVCQPLTAAPWVVAFQENIVNQDNINEISLAGAGRGATLCSVKAFHQMIAQPEHTQNEALGHAQCLSISFSLLLSPPCHSYTETQKSSQIWQSRAAEMKEQRQKLAKGGVPVSPSSPVSAFHQRHKRPVRVKLPVPKPRSGAVSKTMAPIPQRYCLHLISSRLVTHDSSGAMFLQWLKVPGRSHFFCSVSRLAY